MPGDLLDLILVVLAAAFAVAGYRQGFIVGVLSCIGFLAGAAVGATFSPSVAKFLVHGSSQQALVAIILVFIAAMIGQLLASLLGVMVRSRVTWRPVAMVDALGGAAVSVLSVLVIAWFIGSAVVNAPFPAVARQVRSSEVLHGVSDFMPPAAHTMFSDFRHLLDESPYTEVFGALGINGSANVPPPDNAVLSWPVVRRDRNSIVKIWGEAKYTCNRSLEGSGFVISPEHVLTNAHVVAGMTVGPYVSYGGGNGTPATVVLFDWNNDVAILYVPGLTRAAAALRRVGRTGQRRRRRRLPGERAVPRGPGPGRLAVGRQRPEHLQERHGHQGHLRGAGDRGARELRRPTAGEERQGLRGHLRRIDDRTGYRFRADVQRGPAGRPQGRRRHGSGLHPRLPTARLSRAADRRSGTDQAHGKPVRPGRVHAVPLDACGRRTRHLADGGGVDVMRCRAGHTRPPGPRPCGAAPRRRGRFPAAHG